MNNIFEVVEPLLEILIILIIYKGIMFILEEL